MFQVEHYPSENSHGWLVRQFELFRLDDSFLVEKYVPRPDVSLIFHFGNVPFVINDKEVMLKPFFATPIITKSLMLKLQGGWTLSLLYVNLPFYREYSNLIFLFPDK